MDTFVIKLLHRWADLWADLGARRHSSGRNGLLSCYFNRVLCIFLDGTRAFVRCCYKGEILRSFNFSKLVLLPQKHIILALTFVISRAVSLALFLGFLITFQVLFIVRPLDDEKKNKNLFGTVIMAVNSAGVSVYLPFLGKLSR